MPIFASGSIATGTIELFAHWIDFNQKKSSSSDKLNFLPYHIFLASLWLVVYINISYSIYRVVMSQVLHTYPFWKSGKVVLFVYIHMIHMYYNVQWMQCIFFYHWISLDIYMYYPTIFLSLDTYLLSIICYLLSIIY